MTQSENNFIGMLRLSLGLSAETEALDAAAVSELAQRHSVSNLLYYGAKKLPPEQQPEPTRMKQWREFAVGAGMRDAIQQRELAELLDAAERERIDVLPLKGAEIKNLYPQPEMRFMSDTDLLIRPAQAKQMRSCMTALGFRCVKFGVGDTDLYLSPLSMNYEVHRDLSDEGITPTARHFLSRLMNHAEPIDGRRHILSLPCEEHYAYVLCHMAKHLRKGGTGVRSVMDVRICRTRWPLDEVRLNALLTELCLTRFARTAEKLAAFWFGNEQADADASALGDYILGNAVFGTAEQTVLDDLVERKRGYLLHRLFPPFAQMAYNYPILKKCKLLLPAVWLWRIVCTGLFRRKKLTQELSVYRSADGETLRAHAEFLERCGLFGDNGGKL